MIKGIGQEFPYFDLNGVDEHNNIVTLCRDDFEGWKVFYFYPKDFTFICPTEIAGFDTIDEAEVVGFSGDNEFCKMAWRQSNELLENIDHPLLADCGLDLSSELGIVDVDEGVIDVVDVDVVDVVGVDVDVDVNVDAGVDLEDVDLKVDVDDCRC